MNKNIRTAQLIRLTAVAAAVATLASCGDNDNTPEALNVLPSYLGTITSTTYDGNTDDLLTAGLGRTCLLYTSPSPRDS